MSSAWGSRPHYGEFTIVGAAEGRPRLLGEGSFGKTFEAVRIDKVAGGQIEERVALKVLNPSLRINPAKRFQCLQELSALSKLRHPNLIRCIKAGEEDETKEIFFAMDLCLGGDLAKLVKRWGPLPERVAAVIGFQVASGLQLVHREQHVHRDIKPTNIMLAEELSPELSLDQLTQMLEDDPSICRVVDFGLVGTTLNAQSASGAAPQHKFVGSPMYASPEQIREQPDIDGRTDIYALGMTLWYLVQGRGPLLDERGDELKHPHDAMERHLDEEAHEKRLPPRLSPEFRSILAKMVAKRPADRYANAKELSVAFTRYLEKSARNGSSNSLLVVSREPIASLYDFDPNESTSGRSHYLAKHRPTGDRVRLTLVEDLDSHQPRADLDDVIAKLSLLAKELRRPEVPTNLLAFREIIECVDVLAYTETAPVGPPLAALIQARAAAKRPLSFHEAEQVFRPIAETLDYLIAHGWDRVSLPCEQVWINPGHHDGGSVADKQWLGTHLADWPELRVQLSGMWVPPLPGTDASSSMSSMASVMASMGVAGSSFILADSLRHPVSAFLRLIYRTLTASDIPDIADTLASGYVPTASLETASNNLLRDLLCRRKPWPSVTLILNELCANEGVAVSEETRPIVPRPPDVGRSGFNTTAGASRSGTSSLHGSTSASGSAARSTKSRSSTSRGASVESSRQEETKGPSAREAREARACEVVQAGLVRLGDYLQEVDPLTWATADFIQCTQTGRWWFFPNENRTYHAGEVHRPKFVISPYTGEEQEVEWSDWEPGRQINCKSTFHPFVLPQELPYPEGIVPAGSNGKVLSFYAPSAPAITVSPMDWIPGQRVRCPKTGLPFLLPSTLPPLEAITNSQRPGWIESPYFPNSPWTLPPTEWVSGREIICPQTKRKLILPTAVDQWEAEITNLDPITREATSPYTANQRWVVSPEDWHPGGTIKCPPAGRMAKLPSNLPPLTGQVVPGKPGRIISPFTGREMDVPLPRWISRREVVCQEKGRPFLLPPNLPIPNGTVLKERPGVAFSPYDPSKMVKVDALHWLPGEVLVCPTTNERFKLGNNLPVLHALVTPGKQGLVRSPFAPDSNSDSEVEFELFIPVDDWVSGKEFDCRVTNRVFALPPDLEEWLVEGTWVAGRPGFVRSCFAGGGLVELNETTWKPGALVTCPNTKRRFKVPEGDKLPSLALEKAAVEYAKRANPSEDEKSAAAALKSKHKEATPELILAIWKRHELDTATKRQPKVLGTLVPDEPGMVVSPLSGKKQPVAPEDWAKPDNQTINVACAESGQWFILPPQRSPLRGKVDDKRPGYVISPFAPDQPYQITPAEWVEGKQLTCPYSRHPFTLPNRLSAWIPEATLVEGKPGIVTNPFSPSEVIAIEGTLWVPSSIHTTKGRQFKLPSTLPPLVARSVRAEGAEAESPYAPNRFTHVESDQWFGGSTVICGVTNREFVLPAQLPEAVFAGTEPRIDDLQSASIRSPYGRKNRITVAPQDWESGREITCTETGKRLVLPKDLPLLTGTTQVGRPLEVLSPFTKKTWTPVTIADWIEGREITCKETKRRFKLPDADLPPPVAELAKDKPLSAISPFTGKAQVFEPIDWMDGAKVKCPSSKRHYLLPQGLPLCEGTPIGRSTLVRSPFDATQEVRVNTGDWKPGHVLTCPRTTRKFKLPAILPELLGKPITNRLGWITDPYTDSPLQVAPSDWEEKKIIASPDGRKIILDKVPPLVAILIDGKNRIRSPYDLKTEVEIKRKTDWEAGSIVKCGNRQAQLPSPLRDWIEPEKPNILPLAIAVVAVVVIGGVIAWQFLPKDQGDNPKLDDPAKPVDVTKVDPPIPPPPPEPSSPRDLWLKDKKDTQKAAAYLATLIAEFPTSATKAHNLTDQFETRQTTGKVDLTFVDLVESTASKDSTVTDLCERVLEFTSKKDSPLRDQTVLRYATFLERSKAENGRVVSAYIAALDSPLSTTSETASKWLITNVSLLTTSLFEEGLSNLSIDSWAQSMLIEIASQSSSDTLAANALILQAEAIKKRAEGSRKQNENTWDSLAVRQAYLKAAARGNTKAIELLLENVIAIPVKGKSGFVLNPYATPDAPPLRIAAKDWNPGNKLRAPDYLPQTYLQLPTTLPPYVEIAKFDPDDSRYRIATLDQEGTVFDPDGNPVYVPHNKWLPGARLIAGNRTIELPENLPLMDAVIGDLKAMEASGWPEVKSPFTGLAMKDITWEQWKPDAELVEKIEFNGILVVKKVAIMPKKVATMDPLLPVVGPIPPPQPAADATSKEPTFIYQVESPYTRKRVAVPVSDWVKGGTVPERDLQKLGVNVSMVLPANRQVMGWISDLQTFSYLDENRKRTSVKIPSPPKDTDPIKYASDLLSAKGIPGENGLSYRVDLNIKPKLVVINDDPRDMLTGYTYGPKDLYKLYKEGLLNHFEITAEAKSIIDKEGSVIRETRAPETADAGMKEKEGGTNKPDPGSTAGKTKTEEDSRGTSTNKKKEVTSTPPSTSRDDPTPGGRLPTTGWKNANSVSRVNSVFVIVTGDKVMTKNKLLGGPQDWANWCQTASDPDRKAGVLPPGYKWAPTSDGRAVAVPVK